MFEIAIIYLLMFLQVKESEEFVKFIRDAKFYTKSGRDSFMQQVRKEIAHSLDGPTSVLKLDCSNNESVAR